MKQVKQERDTILSIVNIKREKSMGHIDLCLIADHNTDRRNGLKQTICNNSLAKEVVGSLNCGHGLLYLNQSFEKVEGKQVVIILNSKTPMMSGVEFLNELTKGAFKNNANNLKIVVLKDGLTAEDERKYRLHGVIDFIEGDVEDEGLCDKLKNIFLNTFLNKQDVVSQDVTKTKKILKTEDDFQDSEPRQVYFVPKNQAG